MNTAPNCAFLGANHPGGDNPIPGETSRVRGSRVPIPDTYVIGALFFSVTTFSLPLGGHIGLRSNCNSALEARNRTQSMLH